MMVRHLYIGAQGPMCSGLNLMTGHATGLYLERGIGGLPPKLATCPPNFGKGGGRSPHI